MKQTKQIAPAAKRIRDLAATILTAGGFGGVAPTPASAGLAARCLLALAVSSAVTLGQGTLRMTFDGPPVLPPGAEYNVQSYSEAGFWFLPIPGSYGLGRVSSRPPAGLPDNGTAYLDASMGETLMFGREDYSMFDLTSVDLAGYSDVVPQSTTHFVGYKLDGTTVETYVYRNGLQFQTYYFGPEFSGLFYVEIPNFGWSLDNLVLSVPEPCPAALLAVGVLITVAARLRKKK